MYNGNPGEIDFGSSYRESTVYVFITNSLVQLICYRYLFDTDTSEMWTLNSSPLVSISRKFNRIKYLESSVKSLV